MSCFIVQNEHINAILTWASACGAVIWDRELGENTRVFESNADRFGQILMDQNARSYAYRYSDHVEAETEARDACLEYAFKPFPVILTNAELVRACQCLDYQSCETSDWPTTHAAQILNELIASAASKLVRESGCELWEVRDSEIGKLANAPKTAKARKHA